MKVVGLPQLRSIATPDRVLAVVRSALIAHAEDRTEVPAPMHLRFADADGDAHVKAGHVLDSEHFAVKLATGFYRNDKHGLPNNHGLVIVASAKTGEPVAVLDEQGWLTAWRTAAGAALATAALARPGPLVLGIIGTGQQARLAATWHSYLRPIERILVAGRRFDAAAALAADIDAEPVSIDQLLACADAVVTATAATVPLFAAANVRPDTHITALGADLPGKHELPPELFSRVESVVCDDVCQSLAHGDLGHAVQAGIAEPTAALALGKVLRDGIAPRRGAVTIADLTGVGAVDAALADAIVAELIDDTGKERSRQRGSRLQSRAGTLKSVSDADSSRSA